MKADDASGAGRSSEIEDVVQCAKCGHENERRDETCRRCGAHLYLACLHCGKSNERIAKRCVVCGKNLHRRRHRTWRRLSAQEVVILVVGLVAFALLAWLMNNFMNKPRELRPSPPVVDE